jgi:hypothetical protein
MLDGAVLGTALIGQESVRRKLDPELGPTRRRQIRKRPTQTAFIPIRHVIARTLREFANAVEPVSITRRPTKAGG